VVYKTFIHRQHTRDIMTDVNWTNYENSCDDMELNEILTYEILAPDDIEAAAARQAAENIASTGCSYSDTVGHGSKSPIDQSKDDTAMTKRTNRVAKDDVVIEIYTYKQTEECGEKHLISIFADRFNLSESVVKNIRDGVTYRGITHSHTRGAAPKCRLPATDPTILQIHSREDSLAIYAAKREVQSQQLSETLKKRKDRLVRAELVIKFNSTPRCIAEMWTGRHLPHLTKELWEDGMEEKTASAKKRRNSVK